VTGDKLKALQDAQEIAYRSWKEGRMNYGLYMQTIDKLEAQIRLLKTQQTERQP